MILLALLAAACIAAMPVLLSHSSILPEVSTAYYEYKAKEEALTATGPDAELMRLLTGLTADTKLEPVSTPLTFSGYGLLIAVGAVVGTLMLLLMSWKRPDLRSGLLWAAVLAVPFGLIGARLTYCAVNLTFYLNDISAPAAMLKVWEGGLSLAGGLAFIALAGVIAAKLGKVSAGEILDSMSMPMLALCIGASLACEHSDIGFGPEVAGKFGGLTVTIGETLRLNTSVLILAAMLGLYWVWALDKFRQFKKGMNRPDVSFALIAFLYGSVMILLESLRRDGHMLWGFVHAEMLLDLFIALPALLCLARTKKRVLLCTLATAALSGMVIALEFALDRSSIGDLWLYLVYIGVICAYIGLGCACAKKSAAE